MKFLSFIFTIISVFSFLAAADQENYEVAREAAVSKTGRDVDRRYKYAMYEYWHATNPAEACVTGFSHVRLIVGTFSGQDFRGEAFDMISNGRGPSGGAWTGHTAADREENWLANRYFGGDGQIRRVSQPSQYEWAGRVKTGVSNDRIQSIGEGYCRDHSTYNLVRNNCNTYAKWLYNEIKA
ncbi:hypothetical protein AAE478_006551 [Parahypoxylon ruwenzoriense]